MKAPNKIYMPNELLSEEWQRYVEGEDTEYIRKDALLEWLNNEVERYNDKLIQSLNNKEKAIQIASSISSLLVVIARLETL